MLATIPRTWAGLAAVVAGTLSLVGPTVPSSAGPATFRPFTRPLRIPRVIDLGSRPTTIRAIATGVSILPGPRTPMWTFDGTFPGPTLRMRAGHPASVTFVNDLPAAAGSITIHRHGGHHPARDDGQPTRFLIGRGRSRSYDYPMVSDGAPERGAFLWYHDHRMDTTGRNIWRGLAGMAIVQDPRERGLDLPGGRFDVPLMITDRRFTDQNGSPYPLGAATSPPNDSATGDIVLVNGVPQPYFDVAARRYRLRILNASNFTSYLFRLNDGSDLVEIAGGQGLLPEPVSLQSLLLGPAQRAEVIVDFSKKLGDRIELESEPRSQLEPGTGTLAASIMQFRVTEKSPDHSAIPKTLRPRPGWVADAPAVPNRAWVFALGAGTDGPLRWTINGLTFDPGRVDAQVRRGTVESWLFVNASTVSHLVHVHGFPFAILSRDGEPPAPSEAGLEDTTRVDPGERVVVAVNFPDYLGRYVIHCHMLEHEDHGMMAQFEVTP